MGNSLAAPSSESATSFPCGARKRKAMRLSERTSGEMSGAGGVCAQAENAKSEDNSKAVFFMALRTLGFCGAARCYQRWVMICADECGAQGFGVRRGTGLGVEASAGGAGETRQAGRGFVCGAIDGQAPI